ncbi:hypothetical protein BCR44DRAFT_35154 [Catenaria anguillulae PL171]|uniref:Yeast cell wall synthesis Kre9/Knh1-like N-terminal domain-containing protein n=1 Tax=Catenaria anguillulae PL171 TaxID=765915 RepID=A0A1Y2H815_9FUNG|nr:hypothetical protein BCR44DRAFT_35154 [Catenaria anguillulae PL171]
MYSLLALLALAPALAAALQVTVNTPSTPWTAGSSVPITWTTSADGPVPSGTQGSLWLVKVNGNPDNMTPVAQIASGLNANAGQATFNVPAGIVNAADYALQWRWAGQDASTFKYSAPFAVQGGTGATSIFVTGTDTINPTATASRTGSATATTTGTTSATTTVSRSTSTVTVTATPTSSRAQATPTETAGAAAGVRAGGVAAAAVVVAGALMM